MSNKEEIYYIIKNKKLKKNTKITYNICNYIFDNTIIKDKIGYTVYYSKTIQNQKHTTFLFEIIKISNHFSINFYKNKIYEFSSPNLNVDDALNLLKNETTYGYREQRINEIL